MNSHISQFPIGTYKKGHAHGPGAHVIILSGEGYSLMWPEGEEPRRYDWEIGTMVVPPNMWFHQHFNSGTAPARYLAFKHEGVAIRNGQGVPKAWISKRLGGDQIDYADELPAVRKIFADELARHGLSSRMDAAYAAELARPAAARQVGVAHSLRVSRAQRSGADASSARGALQTRDRNGHRLWYGPGSAVHHYVLHRVRDTAHARSNRRQPHARRPRLRPPGSGDRQPHPGQRGHHRCLRPHQHAASDRSRTAISSRATARPNWSSPADVLECRSRTPSRSSRPAVRLYSEMVIHGEVFKARPDVNSVCHHHAMSVLPFCATGVETRAAVSSRRHARTEGAVLG